MLVAMGQQILDKGPSAPADVDNACRLGHARASDQLDGLTRVLLEPADAVLGLRCVDLLPMFLGLQLSLLHSMCRQPTNLLRCDRFGLVKRGGPDAYACR